MINYQSPPFSWENHPSIHPSICEVGTCSHSGRAHSSSPGRVRPESQAAVSVKYVVVGHPTQGVCSVSRSCLYARNELSCFLATLAPNISVRWRQSGPRPECQVHRGPDLGQLTVGYSFLCEWQAGTGSLI